MSGRALKGWIMLAALVVAGLITTGQWVVRTVGDHVGSKPAAASPTPVTPVTPTTPVTPSRPSNYTAAWDDGKIDDYEVSVIEELMHDNGFPEFTGSPVKLLIEESAKQMCSAASSMSTPAFFDWRSAEFGPYPEVNEMAGFGAYATCYSAMAQHS